MLERGIAPPAIVIGQSIVRRTEVGSGDGDGGRNTPFGVVVAPQLIASTAAQAIVEKGSAESCSVSPISLAVQVPIPTCTSCTTWT